MNRPLQTDQLYRITHANIYYQCVCVSMQIELTANLRAARGEREE